MAIFSNSEPYRAVNLNQMCRAKVTDTGWKTFEQKYGQALRMTKQDDIDEYGYSYFQLREFMNMFGVAMRLGAAPPVERNVVEIKQGDL